MAFGTLGSSTCWPYECQHRFGRSDSDDGNGGGGGSGNDDDDDVDGNVPVCAVASIYACLLSGSGGRVGGSACKSHTGYAVVPHGRHKTQ